MVQIVPYRQDVGARPVTGEKQRAVQEGFGEGIGQAADRLGQQAAQVAVVWERQRIAQDEATALELDTGFAEEARKIETGYLAMSGRNAVDAAEKVRADYADLESRYTGMAQNERQRGMLSRVLGQRRARFDGAASTHLVRETDVYRTTAAAARIASLGTDLVSMPDGPERMAGIQAVRNEIDAEAQRKGLAVEVADATFLETISGVHTATADALIEAGDPTKAREYIDRWAPQIEPKALTALRETVRKEVDTFEAITFWDRNPVSRPAPTVTAEVEGSPVTVTLRPPVAARVGSGFGPRRSPGGVGSSNHQGVDFPVPVNTPVTASAPGVVRWKNDPDGYGRYAVVDHGNGLETIYAHLGRGTVAEGTRVEQGDVIGMSGGARGAPGAGNSQGPHVHYEVRQNGAKVDPERALGGEVSVRPGSSAAVVEATPTTLDDVYEAADAAAGGDWRRREVFRAEGVRRFNQERSIRADAENEAERELQDYLPGGSRAVGSISEIPREIIDRVSPQAARAANVAITNHAEGEARLDPVVANDTFNHLADLAATDSAAFLALGELTQYRGILSEAQINSLRGTRRSLATGGPTAEDAVKQADIVFKDYARQAGIALTVGEGRTAEDGEREMALRLALTASVRRFTEANNRAPNQVETVGMLRALTRPVVQDRPRSWIFGSTTEEVSAFEATRPAREVISREQRRAAARALQARYPGRTRPFSEAEIEAQHRINIHRGL